MKFPLVRFGAAVFCAMLAGAASAEMKVLGEEPEHYDVEWKTKDGTTHSFSLLKGGALKSMQVALAETPSAVNAAILQEAGAGRIKEIASHSTRMGSATT